MFLPMMLLITALSEELNSLLTKEMSDLKYWIGMVSNIHWVLFKKKYTVILCPYTVSQNTVRKFILWFDFSVITKENNVFKECFKI